MMFHCRESCGTCGYRSRELKHKHKYLKSKLLKYIFLAFNVNLQKVGEKQYTNIVSKDFGMF